MGSLSEALKHRDQHVGRRGLSRAGRSKQPYYSQLTLLAYILGYASDILREAILAALYPLCVAFTYYIIIVCHNSSIRGPVGTRRKIKAFLFRYRSGAPPLQTPRFCPLSNIRRDISGGTYALSHACYSNYPYCQRACRQRPRLRRI